MSKKISKNKEKESAPVREEGSNEGTESSKALPLHVIGKEVRQRTQIVLRRNGNGDLYRLYPDGTKIKMNNFRRA